MHFPHSITLMQACIVLLFFFGLNAKSWSPWLFLDLVKIMHMRTKTKKMRAWTLFASVRLLVILLFYFFMHTLVVQITIVKYNNSHALLLGPQASFHRWLATEAHTFGQTTTTECNSIVDARGYTFAYAFKPIYNICAIYAFNMSLDCYLYWLRFNCCCTSIVLLFGFFFHIPRMTAYPYTSRLFIFCFSFSQVEWHGMEKNNLRKATLLFLFR